MDVTYAEVGATRTGELPDGYSHLHHRVRLGSSGAAMRVAAAAVMEWRMHRAAGVRLTASASRAAPGVGVEVRLGPLRAPCEIVWTEETERRTGWGYGTLPGHPERGEEAFVVTWEIDDSVWLTVTAFSKPGSWITRVAGPLVPPMQRAYAWRCGVALRRLVTAAGR
jgi:uncharacterized protein (UPF0548 family)